MNFREFVLLNELRYYYSYRTPEGKYITSPMFVNPKERDVMAAKVPGKVWKFEVRPGNPNFNASVFNNIPDATPDEKENIGLSYYSRMGYHQYGSSVPFGDNEGDIIDPEFLDPNHGKNLKPPFNIPQGGTVAFKPKPNQEKTIDYQTT